MKILMTAMMILISTPVFASSRNDDGMFLAYAFLVVCGLIIFLQIIPVLMLMFGMVKGTKKAISK